VNRESFFNHSTISYILASIHLKFCWQSRILSTMKVNVTLFPVNIAVMAWGHALHASAQEPDSESA
jgi:hypothetical protein